MVRFNKAWMTLEGYEFAAFQARIERDRVVRYLDFVGQAEVEAFRQHVCDDVGSVLPTFPFSLEMDAGVVAEVAAVLDIPARYLLHAEQSFACLSPLRCGDLVTVESCLRDVAWKPEKRVCFFGREARFLVGKRLILQSRSVYAVKTVDECD